MTASFTEAQQEMLNQIIVESISCTIWKLSNQDSLSFESLKSFESTDSTDLADDDDENDHCNRWNSTEVRFFDFMYNDKFMHTDDFLKHSDKKTYFRDVHLFIEHVKNILYIKDINLVRTNLWICLQDIAMKWYIKELINDEKRLIKYKDDVNEWIHALIKCFCEQSCIALNMIIKERYIMKDAWWNCKPCKYAQIILKAVKSTKLNFIFNQLSIIYNDIDLKFQKDLMISTFVIKINDFLHNMNNRKYIWWELAAKYRENIEFSINMLNINRSIESSNQRSNDRRDNKDIDQYDSSNSQLNFQRQFQNGFKQTSRFSNYQNNAYQNQSQQSSQSNINTMMSTLSASQQSLLLTNDENASGSNQRSLYSNNWKRDKSLLKPSFQSWSQQVYQVSIKNQKNKKMKINTEEQKIYHDNEWDQYQITIC